jgi:hypothetical protein
VKTFAVRTMVLLAFTAVGVSAPQHAAAQASLGLPPAGASPSSLATPTGRTNITTDATAKINAASRAPIPVASGYVIVRPDLQWVPDRYVAVPGAPQGVLVPGHWEQRLSDREVYVPPLPIIVPGGGSQTIPAGVRPPANQRTEP